MNAKNKVLKKAVSNIAEQLDISDFQLKKIIGINLDEIEQIESSKSFEPALLFIEFYKELYFVFGDDPRIIKIFLISNNKLLKGKPLEIIQNEGGLDFVVSILRGLRIHNFS